MIRAGPSLTGRGTVAATGSRRCRGAVGLRWRSASCPPLAFFFWYNLDRFGVPLESGYALASLPPWLETQRQLGLFSLAHVADEHGLPVLEASRR